MNAVFLEDAEAYYTKYQGFTYWRGELEKAIARFNIQAPNIVVEYGCGFGNTTLPLLGLFPSCRVVATDISPNLLAILQRLLPPRGLEGRCQPVCMDALKPYLREGSADMVFGAAILHHLTQPEDFVAQAMRVVRPGGLAFFFEPLDGGHAVLIQIVDEVLREAKRRDEWNHPLYCLGRLMDDLRPQIFRGGEGWAERDDKWAFSRSKLDQMAEAAGADVRVLPLHDADGQWRRHLSYMLETYVDVRPADLPPWVWEIVDRYDRSTYPPEMLRDLALVSCIVFRRLR